ncbi:MAG TPA: hypothetical protein VGW31_16755 [Hanamia sp.]|nr:hypothetical protein [Hanamia sp.]
MKNILQLIGVLSLIVLLTSCQKEFTKTDTNFTYDVDAQKFIDSSGISDNTNKLAVNDLIKQLKDSSLWTKFIAIYPMLGGTASTTKWNLKDPRDLDAAYRLTFNGNPTYTNTGVLFPTTSDFADTHLKDSELTYNDNAISYYSRTQNTVSGYDMGCLDNAAPFNEMTIYHATNASDYFGYYRHGYTPASTIGLFMLSATSTDVIWYENGINTFSKNAAPTEGFTNHPILIGYVASAASVGMRECALATIGKGLTGAEALTFSNIIRNFITKTNK